MRAWRVGEHGAPADVLRLEDVPIPTPGPGQVRVRVLAAAANFADTLLCRGEYQVRPEPPFTPGVEVCGEVTETGPGVDSPRVGDRVVGSCALPHGSFADEALMPATEALPAPASLDDASAATLYIGYHTAWFALHRRGRLAAGETLLVHAASGGVGSAAVQVGKAAGARVIGVVGGAEKAALARDLGADDVVDRRSEDVVARVKELTDGRGADVVFDSVGGDAYTQSTKCIAFEGRIVVVGFASGRVPEPKLTHPFVKNYAILGLHLALYAKHDPGLVAEAHADLVRLADAGAVRPFVPERLGFDDVPDGLTRLAGGSTSGRLVFLP